MAYSTWPTLRCLQSSQCRTQSDQPCVIGNRRGKRRTREGLSTVIDDGLLSDSGFRYRRGGLTLLERRIDPFNRRRCRHRHAHHLLTHGFGCEVLVGLGEAGHVLSLPPNSSARSLQDAKDRGDRSEVMLRTISTVRGEERGPSAAKAKWRSRRTRPKVEAARLEPPRRTLRDAAPRPGVSIAAPQGERDMEGLQIAEFKPLHIPLHDAAQHHTLSATT